MTVTSSRSRNMAIAVAGTLIVAAYAALGAMQILVLNPLAAAPGRTLEVISAEMAAMNESLSPVPVIIFVMIGLGLALAVLVLAAPRSDASARGILTGYLIILVGGAPAYFVASFGAGMALADTYGISGADYSPWANVLYVISGLALLGLLAVTVHAFVESARTRRPAISAG